MSLINQAGKVGQLSPITNDKPSGLGDLGKVQGEGFKDVLRQVRDQATEKATAAAKPNGNESGIRFSNHAVERMRSRGIVYGPETLDKIGQAMQKAAAKGAKETLVLTDNSALIVSVKNNTVVTVMDKNALKENVFTNIDSTVVI